MIPEAKRPGALELEITRTGGGSAPALRGKGVRAVKGAPESGITLAGERLYPRKAEEAEFRFHISRLYEKADGILIDVMLDYMDGRGSDEYDVTVYLDGTAVRQLPACRLVTDMRDVIVVK